MGLTCDALSQGVADFRAKVLEHGKTIGVLDQGASDWRRAIWISSAKRGPDKYLIQTGFQTLYGERTGAIRFTGSGAASDGAQWAHTLGHANEIKKEWW